MANFIDLCLNISGNYNEFILEQKDFFFLFFLFEIPHSVHEKNQGTRKVS